ncbi:MAG: transglutaminase domain-containing protein [SAR202 cluster bacterium]|nr:transglutaminase domain-containing protein [SAR202 cluster bacterium]|tara:strand:+ start:3413 stop:5689 length:2277 start_codon:yes stop_codon:yes gene_type:complete
MQEQRQRLAGFFVRIIDDGRSVTIVLTILMSMTVIFCVEQAGWISPSPSLMLVGALGLVLGFRSALNTKWRLFSHFTAVLVGFLYIFFVTALLVAEEQWADRLSTLSERLIEWFSVISLGGGSTDTIPLIFGLAIGVWFASYITAFLTLYRKSVWSLLPMGVLLFTNLTYLPEKFSLYLVLYLLISALLLSHFYFQKQIDVWGRTGVALKENIQLHFLHYALWFSIGSFLISLIIPSLSIGPPVVQDTWNNVRSPVGAVEDHFNRILAAVPGKKDHPMYRFGPDVSFRGEISLGENVVYIIDSPIESYWRGRTYDEYNGWGWQNADRVEKRVATPGRDIFPIASKPSQTRVDITVIPQIPTKTLVYVGEPISLSVSSEVLAQPAVAGNAPPEILSLRSPEFLGMQDLYSFNALVSIARKGDLEGVQGVFPRWLKERYVQLPDDFPARVQNLARELTLQEKTVYDKVRAVEFYLREIPYTQEIQSPPVGSDGVEYFLFEARRGYSDYYASAMVMMLRSVGIPARFVTGYLPGEFDAEERHFIVRENDAHSWAEVYFPPYGWIAFEPTNIVPVSSLGSPRSIEQRDVAVDQNTFSTEGLMLDIDDETALGDEALDEELSDVRQPDIVSDQLPIFALILIGFLLIGYVGRRYLRSRLATQNATQNYNLLILIARFGRVGPEFNETLGEYKARLQSVAPKHSIMIDSILEGYEAALFGRSPIGSSPISIQWFGLTRSFLAIPISSILRLITGRSLRRHGFES